MDHRLLGYARTPPPGVGTASASRSTSTRAGWLGVRSAGGRIGVTSAPGSAPSTSRPRGLALAHEARSKPSSNEAERCSLGRSHAGVQLEMIALVTETWFDATV